MNQPPKPFAVPELIGLSIVSFRIDAETSTHTFDLSNKGSASTGGLWRLLADGRIVGTSADIGLTDWRPNSASLEEQIRNEMTKHLFGIAITGAEVSVPTGDLTMSLENGVSLELLKDQSFLECWEVLSGQTRLLVDAWGNVNKW